MVSQPGCERSPATEALTTAHGGCGSEPALALFSINFISDLWGSLFVRWSPPQQGEQEEHHPDKQTITGGRGPGGAAR